MTPFTGRSIDSNITCPESSASDRCHEQMFSLPPFKTVQHDDDVTTAYSSWNDEEDNRDFSPCRSTRDDEVDIENEDDDSGSGKEDKNFVTNHWTQETPLQLIILHERAAILLRREMSSEYRVASNCCLVGQTTTSFHTMHLQDTPQRVMSASAVARREDEASASSSTSVIDATCRSKMMEWAIRVVEFSYPPPHQSNSTSPHTPTHSRETLCIVSTAFSYVDRIMTQSRVQTCSSQDTRKLLLIPTRKEYKLLCMVSLNLAAKVSGLFDCGDRLEFPVMQHVKGNRGRIRPRAVNVDRHSVSRTKCSPSVSTSGVSIGTGTTTTCSSSNSLVEQSSDQDPSSDDTKNQQHSALNHHPSRITPTPHRHQNGRHPPYQNQENIRQRPFLNLISLAGLYSLCQGEFTVREMRHMELSILKALDWKLNCALVLEWLDLIIEWGTLHMNTSENFMNGSDKEIATRYDWEEIRESALFHLEKTIKSSEFMTVIPSALAIAAIVNATEKYDHSRFLISQLIHSFGFSYDIEDLMTVKAAIKLY